MSKGSVALFTGSKPIKARPAGGNMFEQVFSSPQTTMKPNSRPLTAVNSATRSSRKSLRH